MKGLMILYFFFDELSSFFLIEKEILYDFWTHENFINLFFYRRKHYYSDRNRMAKNQLTS